MSREAKDANPSGVDKGLIAMFLKMSPEERLRANDNAFRAIMELRDAYLKLLIELKRTSTDLKDKTAVTRAGRNAAATAGGIWQRGG